MAARFWGRVRRGSSRGAAMAAASLPVVAGGIRRHPPYKRYLTLILVRESNSRSETQGGGGQMSADRFVCMVMETKRKRTCDGIHIQGEIRVGPTTTAFVLARSCSARSAPECSGPHGGTVGDLVCTYFPAKWAQPATSPTPYHTVKRMGVFAWSTFAAQIPV